MAYSELIKNFENIREYERYTSLDLDIRQLEEIYESSD